MRKEVLDAALEVTDADKQVKAFRQKDIDNNKVTFTHDEGKGVRGPSI